MKTLHVEELTVGNRDGQHLRLTPDKITITDALRRNRVHLCVDGGGSPYLELYDGNGTPRVIVQVQDNGCPALRLYDGNCTTRFKVDIEPDEGNPSLTLSDKGGERVCDLALTWHEGVRLRRVDQTGELKPWGPSATETTIQQMHQTARTITPASSSSLSETPLSVPVPDPNLQDCLELCWHVGAQMALLIMSATEDEQRTTLNLGGHLYLCTVRKLLQ